MPFHKLSQWLSYSLIEPLRMGRLRRSSTIDGLTGLPEYRNGGLFLDAGVLALKDPAEAELTHAVDSRLVVEWRALTVALLDRIAELDPVAARIHGGRVSARQGARRRHLGDRAAAGAREAAATAPRRSR